MKVAILGATSQIAQDLILSFSINKDYIFFLFGRNNELLERWINSKSLSEKYQAKEYSEFGINQKYDVIINFVGIGDPAKAQKMGSDIFKVTEQYDNMALEYLKQHKKTKYIFLSSGAVYGGNYQEPVDKNTVATIDVNNLKPTDWYTLAKLYAEAKHRSLSNLSIVDIRVFNYFSHTQDMNARFLITDVARAIKNKEVFKTSSHDIMRDFISVIDFYNFIQSIIKFTSVNIAIDCYTKSPVSKFDLLKKLKNKFGLSYEIDNSKKTIDPTGIKKNYYSKYRLAEIMGYKPINSSLSNVLNEIKVIVNK